MPQSPSLLAQDGPSASGLPQQEFPDTRLEIERLKNAFINTLVRDIRLPLTSVSGVMELFESKLLAREAFDSEDRQLLSCAIEHADRICHLVDDLLEVARQHETPLTLALETIRVDQLLEEAAEPLRGESALRGVELNVHVVAHSLQLHVDKTQACRAVCHLLKAALAATPDGGCVAIVAREIVGTRAGEEGQRFIVISVSDSSEGIPPEDTPFIFDAFGPTGDSKSAPVRGVGLSIAKRIAAAHGGNVSVRSQPGMGTTYSIVFSTFQLDAEISARRILIVDDTPELLLLLRKLVSRMEFQTEVAAGAVEALRILNKKKIDLLLTDWAMPEMNGEELIAAVRKNATLTHIPVVVLSGHDGATERSNAMAAGCDRFLVKPVKFEKLERVITELLNGSRADGLISPPPRSM